MCTVATIMGRGRSGGSDEGRGFQTVHGAKYEMGGPLSFYLVVE